MEGALGRDRYPCAAQTCVEEAPRGDGGARGTPAFDRRLERPQDRPEALVAVALVRGVDLAAEPGRVARPRVVRRHVADDAVDALALPLAGEFAELLVAHRIGARRAVGVAPVGLEAGGDPDLLNL